MKQDFVQPRFDGPRFNEKTLPLDVARDLIAYEELVIELAKRIYLRENPSRKRVPKGFEAGFHLHLERVDDGSARPLLALVLAGALSLSGGSPTCFEKSRDLIAETIAAPDNDLPKAFPKELLDYFNRVGRSLQTGEKMELLKTDGEEATLTPERRKRLVLAAKSRYEDAIELVGTVEEVNWKRDKETFRLRIADRLVDLPMPKAFEKHARNCGGKERIQVTVKGLGEFDAKGDLKRVIKVRSFEVQPDFQIATRLDEIAALADGWHDGTGVAPDPDKLAVVFESLVGHYPENLPLPIIVPTSEGNLLFEWKGTGDPSLDISLDTQRGDFHVLGDQGDDIEASFDLHSSEDWNLLFEFLTRHLTGDRNDA